MVTIDIVYVCINCGYQYCYQLSKKCPKCGYRFVKAVKRIDVIDSRKNSKNVIIKLPIKGSVKVTETFLKPEGKEVQ